MQIITVKSVGDVSQQGVIADAASETIVSNTEPCISRPERPIMTEAFLPEKLHPTSVTQAWTDFACLNFATTAARQGVHQVRVAGAEALARLLPVALRETGQSRVVARFLLNLYNGNRFPFDMTDFRLLDHCVFVDCMTVLHMDWMPEREVHEYFVRGGKIWTQMAKDWGFRDYKGESWR